MVWMIDAKRKHDWQLASTLVWITAEVNRDRKRRRKPFKPDDFNPCVTTRPAPAKASVEQVASLLGAVFQPRENESPCPKSEPDLPTSNC